MAKPWFERGLWSLRLVVATLFASIIAGVALEEASARAIEVAAQTNIEVSFQAVGRELRVEGRLRDNVAQGLGYQPMTLRWRLVGEQAWGGSRRFDTNRLGRFEETATLEEGEWELRVDFAGTGHYDAAYADSSVLVRRDPLELEIIAPTFVPVGANGVSVQVAALSPGATGLTLQLTDGCAEEERRDVTLQPGGLFAWEFGAPMAAGTCEIRVEYEGGARFREAEFVRELRLVGEPTVTLFAEKRRHGMRIASDWVLTGTVVDEAGPLSGAPLTANFSDNHNTQSEALRANALGLYSMRAGIELLPRGKNAVRVDFEVEAGDGVARGQSRTHEITRRRSFLSYVPMMAGSLLGLVCLAMLAGLALERARRRPDEAAGPEPEVAAASVEVVADESDDERVPVGDTVWGRVRDAETREAIPSVLIHFEAGGEAFDVISDRRGDFRFPRPEGDTVVVQASADGYMPLDETVRLPTAGHRLAVTMRSVRCEVREVFKRLVDQFGDDEEMERWWGRLTPAEVSEKLADRIQRLYRKEGGDPVARSELDRLLTLVGDEQVSGRRVLAADALQRLVDVVYFGVSPWPVETVGLADELAGIASADEPLLLERVDDVEFSEASSDDQERT